MLVLLALALALSPVEGLQEAALPPEPPPEQQKEAFRILKDLFKDDYAKRSPADVREFSRKLLDRGLETRDDALSRFVMLREARDLAVQAGDAETAHRACVGLETSFAVDGPAMKLAALGKAAPGAKDADAVRALVRAYLATAEEAVRADALEAASAAATRAEAAARAAQDPPLAARAAETKREMASLKDEWQKAKSGEPDAAGRYLCFVKGDWEKGLPLLASGGKEPLKSLAAKDAGAPSEPLAQAELAEGWWELAQKEKSAWRKSRIAARARHWIDLALPAATGLVKVKLEKRLEEAEAAQPGYVNLLKLVDVKKDAVNGAWTLKDGRIHSDAAPCARIEIPYRPPDEYDLHAVFSRIEGGNDVNLLLTRKGRSFALVLGGGSFYVGLGNHKGNWTNSPANPTVGKLAEPFALGRPIQVLVEVRRDRVRVLVDGKPVLDWKTDYSDLSPNVGWKLRDDTLLGLGSFESPTAFHKLFLVEVGGSGKKSR
jgi:hypothetical protein